MEPVARAFVAVAPPPDVAGALVDRLRAAQRLEREEGLRWVPPPWHVTVAFLGRVDAPEALIGALAGALADCDAPMVRLGGAGAFPRSRRATVLWVGFVEGAEGLGDLAARVTSTTATLGFEAESREYRPHLTVARSARGRDLRRLVDALGEEPVGRSWCVDQAILVASELGREGPRHTEVSRFPLRGSQR